MQLLSNDPGLRKKAEIDLQTIDNLEVRLKTELLTIDELSEKLKATGIFQKKDFRTCQNHSGKWSDGFGTVDRIQNFCEAIGSREKPEPEKWEQIRPEKKKTGRGKAFSQHSVRSSAQNAGVSVSGFRNIKRMNV